MCFGGKPASPPPPPPPPPPVSVPVIGDPEEATGVNGSRKRKRVGVDKLQIPLTAADTSSGLGVPGA